MDSLISIITTVRNGEEYLLETLESIKAQTFENFEHIVVDDGSTDKTVLLLKQFKETNPDYPLFVYEPGNLGRGTALNYAISKAKGEWIAIIDADDIWHPQKLEIQSKCISNNNIDVLATSVGLFREKAEIMFQKIDEISKIQYFSINDLLKSNRLSHSSVLIKREFCKYDESRKSQFDFDLWLRLASNKKTLAKVNLLLNFHRIHDNQSFEAKNKFNYRMRAFKINAYYCLKYYRIDILFVKLIKLIIVLIIPRKLIHKQLQK